jgi:putative phosphoesterase
MEIAVMSDIHGNYIALERCLEYAFSQNIGTFIFLGDYIGELAYPERTMQILYDLNDRYKCYFIKGNKEDYWLGYRTEGEQGWKDKDSTTGSLLYAYKSLKARDIDFFEKLKIVMTLKLNGLPDFTLCHGSPRNNNHKLLPNDDRTIEVINNVETPIILCGHSHIQRKFTHNEKCVLNPGSVGVPLFSKGETQFMILHGIDGKWVEEFISLKYDVDRVILDMHEEKLDEHAPYWSKITEHILRGGNTSHGTVLSRAMELCREETGKCVWPDIPEECWEQAVNEMIG